MKFNGENLIEVYEEHIKFIESGGELEECRADFSDADLKARFLGYSDWYGADFRRANCFGACFCHSNLSRADFTGANIWQADFFHASLHGVIGFPYRLQSIPDAGSFIAWKRVKLVAKREGYENSAIAKLLVPEDAQREALPNGEYRASKVKVLEIQSIDGDVLQDTVGLSPFDLKTRYIAGETVEEPNYGTEMFQNMQPGIYFYLQREAAVRYLVEGLTADGVAEMDMSRVKELGYFPGFGTPQNVLVTREEVLKDLAKEGDLT